MMNLFTIILIVLFAYVGIVLLLARKRQQNDKFVLRIFLYTIYWIVAIVLPIIILSPVGVYYFIMGGKIYILFYLLVAVALFIPFRRRVSTSCNKK